MVFPASSIPTKRNAPVKLLGLALVAVIMPTAQPAAHAQRVVGPVTFEQKEWLGVDVNDLELDRFDGSTFPTVSFAFSSTQNDAGAAAIRVGPEDAAYVQGQGLEGPSESVLILEFAEPIKGFQAGMAFLAERAEKQAVRLEASSDAGVEVYARDFSSAIGSASLFAGTLVQADFEGPVTRVRLRIMSTARRFFLDNLVFTFDGTGLPSVEPPDATTFEGLAPKAQMIRMADSRAVAVWPDDGKVRFQMISENGEPEQPIRIANAFDQSGWAPAVSPYGDGFVLAWYGRENGAAGPEEGVYLRLHGADGSPVAARVPLFSPQVRRATRVTLGITSLGDQVIVTWDDGEKLGAVRYRPADGTVTPIATTAESSDCGLHVVTLATQTAMLWCAGDLWVQFHGPGGNALGDPRSLNEGLAGSPRLLRVAQPPRAGVSSRAVLWTQQEADGGARAYVRTLTDGGLSSPAVRVGSTLATQTVPAIAAHVDGSFLVGWLVPNRPGVTELPRRFWVQAFYATGVAATEPLEPMSGLDADPESITMVWNGHRATVLWENSLSSATRPGSYLSTFRAQPDQKPCRASNTSLCLQENRFAVTVQYRDFGGVVGTGRPVGLTSDTGYFWFFDQGAADLVVKVLDGRSSNGHHWVYFGSLTNVAFDLMVEDRITGQTATYSNALGSFASAGDTRAFEFFGAQLTSSEASIGNRPSVWSNFETRIVADLRAAEVPQSRCEAALEDQPLAACLSDRFLIEVQWQDFSGSVGDGHGQAISTDTASFWFFDAANLELVIKVLDGNSINGHFWVFFGSLTNVAFDLTVTDLQTGTSRTWSNPGGVFASQGDTTALPGD